MEAKEQVPITTTTSKTLVEPIKEEDTTTPSTILGLLHPCMEEAYDDQLPTTNPPSKTLTPDKKTTTSSPDHSILTKFHSGYFRICLSLAAQSLLWKTLCDAAAAHRSLLPSFACLLLWSLSLLSLLALALLFTLRCLLLRRPPDLSHPIAANYLFAPSTAALLLLQSTPSSLPLSPGARLLLWWGLSLPTLALDVKIYGQWITGRRKFLSMVANPANQMSVIGNMVGARAAAAMGWREVATCMFSVGTAHYLVLFVTLYQRLQDASAGGSAFPARLRPVFFLFFAAPSVASLAWQAIVGSFGVPCKMLFFLSLFLFASLVSRPALFKRSMKQYNVAWWAYSFPLSVLALAATEYAKEVKGQVPNALMLLLIVLSVIVTLTLMLFTTLWTAAHFP